MLNTTQGEVVFRVRGLELDRAVREALELAAEAHLDVYRARNLDLRRVTTKTLVKLGFAKFVLTSGLLKSKARFDEAYVRNALHIYATAADAIEPQQYAAVVRAPRSSDTPFKPAYKLSVRSGIALMLVGLHSAGAITLPFSFNWPGAKKPDGNRIELAPFVGSPLLKLIRSVSLSSKLANVVFETVLTHERRRSWFTSNCTKLLLATGWNFPEDIDLQALLALKDANDATNFTRCGRSVGFRALVDVLERQYGSGCISVRDWDRALKSAERLEQKTCRVLLTSGALGADEAFGMQPSTAYPERLTHLKKLPGLDGDFQVLSRTWLKLQTAYLKKIRLERPVSAKRALGLLNLYLFFYLPYWFMEHADTQLAYPTTPSTLTAGIFVSPLIELEFESPDTFVEFMERYASEREWKSGSGHYYSSMKDVESFFNFLEQNSKELPGCKGFTQPLSPHDMPRVSRLKGTNKRPIPAKDFTLFVSYVNALVDYLHVVLERVLSEHISQTELKLFGVHQFVIDTFAVAQHVGYVPFVSHQGRTFPLQFVPNIFDLRQHKLKDGRLLGIPTPHGIHHVCVATLTGIRGQHIRWLDETTFDSLVSSTDASLALLLVNTDKQKKQEWTPHVNMRTIQVLRLQRAWRDLIRCPAFEKSVHYNRNPKSKWGAIKPLFADSLDGYPHAEKRYETSWGRVLLGFQGLLADLNVRLTKPLCQLLPTSVPSEAADKQPLLDQYRDSRKPLVSLVPKGDITPHSARVGVVSRLITFLPPDVIGQNVTGQTPAVVHHYVYVDPEQTLDRQQTQKLALHLNNFAIEAPHEVGNTVRHPRYTNPSDVNSNLAKALKVDVGETIESYGCVSLVLKEGATSGVDVLRETRGADVAFNKTEVCPFGNNCPPDVVKELEGFRRCARCWYAVRCISHLPPVNAKIKFQMLLIESLEARLSDADAMKRRSAEEQKQLEAERQHLAFDLACWKGVALILEAQRKRLEEGADDRQWLVPKPELLSMALKRVPIRTNSAEFLLALLGECVAYDAISNSETTAKIDLLRRQLLADVGDVRRALKSEAPVNLAQETFGLLRAVAKLHSLTVGDFERALADQTPKQLRPGSVSLLAVADG